MRRAALVAVALLSALPLVAASPARATTSAACQADGDHIALVVDFGDHVEASCVTVPSGSKGYAVLGDRARIGTSGLVCAIDGVPATGCGDRTSDGHYAYWSYWHGTASGGWSYASVGPQLRASPTVVEGWRWNPSGNADPTDPSPRGSPDPSSTCATATIPASTQPTPPSTATVDPGAVASTPATATTAIGAAAAPSSTTLVGATGSSASSSSASTSSSSASGTATARANGNGSGSGGSPAGVVAGIGLLGALAIGALTISRRRGRVGP